MILVVSFPEDVHAQAVMAALSGLGEQSALLDLASFPQQSKLTVVVEQAASRSRLTLPGGQVVALEEVKAIWHRRLTPFAPSPGIRNAVHHEFVVRECEQAFAGLWATLPARWVNPPARDEVADRKLWQLALARRLGLAVPRSCVTNEPEEARAFLGSCRETGAIYKELGGATKESWHTTRKVGGKEERLLESVSLGPVYFQEYVEAEADLRVTVVGGEVFAAEIDARHTANPLDWRGPQLDEARVEAARLPAQVEEALRHFMAEAGLVYGAFDLRRRKDGAHVFLEVNPAGQWLFVEQRTGLPITRAVALALARPCRAA